MKFKTLLLTAVISFSANSAEVKENPSASPEPGFFGGVGVGPDAFGYTGTDSNSGSCSSQFVDITGTGTFVVSGDDAGAVNSLAAPFNFYGSVYSDLVFTTNGAISTDLTDTGGDLSNDCPLPVVPSTSAGARMYALHDDLVTNGGIYYQYFPVCPRPSDNFPDMSIGCHVVQWDDVNHFGGADSFGFEALLYDLSWEIVFVQGSGNSETGSGSTTGLQNEAATIGITYACNVVDSIPASSAQCFTHPEPDGSLFPVIPVPTNNNITLMLLAGVMGLAALFLFRRKLSV